MIRLIAIIITATILSGCAATFQKEDWTPPVVARSPIQNVLDTVPELDGPKITIAVYKFEDKT